MHTLLLALALQIQIPAPTGYVNDLAGIIDEGTRQAMLSAIDEVREKSRGEIVVVTLRDLGGRASIDVARDIGRQWKVGAMGGAGDAARNAGVLVLLKPGARPGDGQAEIAIATGSGAEGFITDALAGRIRDAIGEAAVNAGRYDAGLLVGVQLLAQGYAREFGFELSGSASPPQEVTGRAPSFNFLPLLVLFFMLMVFLGRGRRGRPRGLLQSLLWAMLWSGRGGGGWGGGGRGGWGGGGGRGGGFGGFGGGGGFSGGGASGRF